MKEIIDFALFVNMDVKDCTPKAFFATFKLKSGKSVSRDCVKVFDKFDLKTKLSKLSKKVKDEIKDEHGLKEE